MADAQQVLDIAGSQVGYTRWDDPEEGSKYGRWYAGKTGSGYFGASGVPFCAMGVCALDGARRFTSRSSYWLL